MCGFAHACSHCSGKTNRFFGDTGLSLCEGDRQIEGGGQRESLSFPDACPTSPQSATGTSQQHLHDISTLACCPEKEALSLAQSMVRQDPWRAAASMEPVNSIRRREVCLICHLLPVMFLVSGQEESQSHRFHQTHH